jgi:hypothetical protein
MRHILPIALALLWVAPAWTQVIPNPLMRPQRTQPSQPQGQTPDPQARGATTAPSPAPAGRSIARGAEGGEGLPAEGDREKPLSEQLANLYVSAVIGDRAVLRSLEVRTVPRLGGSSASGGTASGGTRSGETGGGGGSSDVGGLRSQVYVVRNGEVLPFLDRTRLLVRVRDTTVTLFGQLRPARPHGSRLPRGVPRQRRFRADFGADPALAHCAGRRP